ncbi:MAG: glycosyl hydrolase, partial [candidate division KSB1 bacterium]|nr:glycosyl hydrolase [candidate division KSB1 bacterium]
CPEKAVLPAIDKFQRQRYYIEIFNRGSKPFDFRVRASKPWVNVSQTRGRVEKEIRIWVSVDWDRVPAGSHMASLQISGPKGRRVEVEVPVHNPAVPEQEVRGCFVESNGCISIEAEHSARVVNTGSVFWQVIPDLGRTMSGVTPFPVTMPRQTPPGTARLEYDVYLFSSGQVKVVAYLSPTLNFLNTDGLQFAVSFDDEVPQVVNMHAGMTYDDWEERVRNNVVTTSTVHLIQDPGRHVLKIWAVDPGVVLQKIVIDAGGVKPSYLGPPESYRAPLN